MQQIAEERDRSQRNNKRIHSIAALQKLDFSKYHPMSKSKEMKQFYLQREQSIQVDKKKLRQGEVVKKMDKMQQETDQLVKMVEMKQNKERYLEMRLNQILTKQDENIIKLKEKLRGLQHSLKEKDKRVDFLRMQLQSVNTDAESEIYPTKTAQSKYSIVKDAYSTRNTSKQCSTQKYYTTETQPTSPFSSQPLDKLY